MKLIDEKWLFEEFNIEKNNEINIEKITYSNTEKIWWKCSEGHEWQARYISRSKRKSKCTYCGGLRAIPGVNDLATEYPELIKEWDFLKNEVNPINIKSVSGKKVWWKCVKGHEWQAVINTRTKRGYKCPYCSGNKIIPNETDFATLCPELAKEWDFKRNKDIEINKLGHSSHKEVWWLCKRGHSYNMSIQKRTDRGDGCPYCAGRYAIKGENDLETLRPDILEMWNFEKNTITPAECKVMSGKLVWWKCKKGHEWEKFIIQQVKYNFCPYCEGKKLIVGLNDVLSRHPELENLWNEEKNRKKPEDVKYSSKRKMWWKCDKGHEWQATMDNVAKGKRCPYCARKIPINGVNDLETLNPQLVEEWNYERNIVKPNDFLLKSNKKVWWKCDKGHEWKAAISDRTKGCGCPICFKTRR